MKIRLFTVAILAALNFSQIVFAKSTVELKGSVDLDQYNTTETGLSLLSGPIKGSAKIEIDNLRLEYIGYKKEIICTGYGSPSMEDEEDDAPCLNTATRWLPNIKISAMAKVQMKIADLSSSSYQVVSNADWCVGNLGELMVIGETEPTQPPQRIVLSKSCFFAFRGEASLAGKSAELKNAEVRGSLGFSLSLDLGGEMVINDGIVRPENIAYLNSSNIKIQGAVSNEIDFDAKVKSADGKLVDLFTHGTLPIILR